MKIGRRKVYREFGIYMAPYSKDIKLDHCQLIDIFNKFRNECIWLRNCYNTHDTLFNSGKQTDSLLIEVAGSFFHDLSIILQEYCIQRVCVLTDPACYGSRKNLSIHTINQALDNLKLMTPKIMGLSESLNSYRYLVVTARNKLLSHIDLNVVTCGPDTLGEHAPGEVTTFFENLQLYCDEVGIKLGVGPLDFRVTPCKGDVLDLLRHLKKGRDF